MSQTTLSVCRFVTALIGPGFWLVLSITAFLLMLVKLSSLVGATQMPQRRVSFVHPVLRALFWRLFLSAEQHSYLVRLPCLYTGSVFV